MASASESGRNVTRTKPTLAKVEPAARCTTRLSGGDRGSFLSDHHLRNPSSVELDEETLNLHRPQGYFELWIIGVEGEAFFKWLSILFNLGINLTTGEIFCLPCELLCIHISNALVTR